MDFATNSLGLYDFFNDRGWTVMSAVSILQAYYYFRNIELQRVLENSFRIMIIFLKGFIEYPGKSP